MLNGSGSRTPPKITQTQRFTPPMIPLPKPAPRIGQTTQRFFEEGERHEAADWNDTILPLDDEPEIDPEAEFDSFDRIPRRRGPIIAVITMGVLLLVGVGVGLTAALETGRSVRKSLGEFLGTTAASQAAPPTTAAVPPGTTVTPSTTADPTINANAVVPAPTVAVPTLPPASAEPAAAAPAAQAVPPLPPPSEAVPAHAERTAQAAGQGKTPVVTPLPATPEVKRVTRARARPRQDYVWSAAANALVPAEPAQGGTSFNKRTPPLRDYVWSPSANALVPAYPAASNPQDSDPKPDPKPRRGATDLRGDDATIAPASTGSGPRERPASLNPAPARHLKPSPFESP